MTKPLRVFQLISICQGLNKTQVIFSLLLNKQLAAISMGLLAITTAGCWENNRKVLEAIVMYKLFECSPSILNGFLR